MFIVKCFSLLSKVCTKALSLLNHLKTQQNLLVSASDCFYYITEGAYGQKLENGSSLTPGNSNRLEAVIFLGRRDVHKIKTVFTNTTVRVLGRRM